MKFINIKLTSLAESYRDNGAVEDSFKKYSGKKLLRCGRLLSIPSWIPVFWEKARMKMDESNFDAVYNLDVHGDLSYRIKIKSDGKGLEVYVAPKKRGLLGF